MSSIQNGFVKMGNGFRKVTVDLSDFNASMPTGFYALRHDPIAGLWLDSVEPYKLPEKIYGKLTQNRAERVLATFEQRAGNTGVMMSGEKGSGKTLLVKHIATEALKRGISVVQIDGKSPNIAATADYLAKSDVSLVVVFDEFEKIIGRDDQVHLLSLLDGLGSTKHLFLLSSNSARVDDRMMNRPGRIYYYFEYGALEEAFVREYVTDHLKDKSLIEKLCESLKVFRCLNFDIMSAVVQEMNCYNESPLQAMSWLNASPAFEDSSGYRMKAFVNNEPLELQSTYTTGSPVIDGDTILVYMAGIRSGRSIVEPDPEFANPSPLARCVQSCGGCRKLRPNDFVRFENGDHIYELHRTINLALLPPEVELDEEDAKEIETKTMAAVKRIAADANMATDIITKTVLAAKRKQAADQQKDEFVSYTLRVVISPVKLRRAHGFAGSSVPQIATRYSGDED